MLFISLTRLKENKLNKFDTACCCDLEWWSRSIQMTQNWRHQWKLSSYYHTIIISYYQLKMYRPFTPECRLTFEGFCFSSFCWHVCLFLILQAPNNCLCPSIIIWDKLEIKQIRPTFLPCGTETGYEVHHTNMSYQYTQLHQIKTTN